MAEASRARQRREPRQLKNTGIPTELHPGVKRADKNFADLTAGKGQYKPTKSGHASFTDKPTRRSNPRPVRPAHPYRAITRAVPNYPKSYTQTLVVEYLAAAVLIMVGVVVGTDSYVKKMSHALVRLTALTGVFFVLALMATGEKSGKFAASFGLLIDIAVLFDQAHNGNLKGIKDSLKSAGGDSESGGGGGAPPRAEVAAYDTDPAIESLPS